MSAADAIRCGVSASCSCSQASLSQVLHASRRVVVPCPLRKDPGSKGLQPKLFGSVSCPFSRAECPSSGWRVHSGLVTSDWQRIAWSTSLLNCPADERQLKQDRAGRCRRKQNKFLTRVLPRPHLMVDSVVRRSNCPISLCNELSFGT
jgi:hypothetical protein